MSRITTLGQALACSALLALSAAAAPRAMAEDTQVCTTFQVCINLLIISFCWSETTCTGGPGGENDEIT